MIIKNIKNINGLKLIKLEPSNDKRGSFTRIFCRNIFSKNKMFKDINQINLSHNKKKGTFRGFHFQKKPHEEKKFIFCISGKIHMGFLDLRKNSTTYLQIFAKKFIASNKFAIYVPDGVATAFLTLVDNSNVIYLMSERYVQSSSSGINYKDPKIKIKWPLKIKIISTKDKNFPFIE